MDAQRLIPDSDSIILSQLLSTLNESLSCKGGLSGVLRALGGGAIKLVASLVVHRLFKGGDVWSVLRFILIRFVYRRTRLSSTEEKSVSMLQEYNALFPTPNEEVSVSNMPVYMVKDTGDHVLYTCPYVHTAFVNDLESRADDSLIHKEFMATVCRDSNGKVFISQPLFASNNYLALAKRVTNYFVRKCTGMISPPLIVLQGEAGLGKTDSFHYISQLGICGEIRVISLTGNGMINKSFSSILQDLMSKRYTTPTIVYFDELDKYLDMYFTHAYTTAKTSKVQGTRMDEVVDDNFDVFVSSVKKSVIMSIAGLIENWHVTFPGGVVYVFCSNNFHTLFRGVDNTHLNSVKTRFTFIKFEKCGKAELCRYLDAYNDKLPKDLQYAPDELRECFTYIQPDISVTYRTIQIAMGVASYEIRDFVHIINRELDNPIIAMDDEYEDVSPRTLMIPQITSHALLPETRKIMTVEDRKQQKEDLRKVSAQIQTIIRDYKLSDIECMDRVIELANGYDMLVLAQTMAKGGVNEHNCSEPSNPLNSSIEHGRVPLLKYFIRIGVDLTVEDRDSGNNLVETGMYDVMYHSKTHGIEECIRILMDEGLTLFGVTLNSSWIGNINSMLEPYYERCKIIANLIMYETKRLDPEQIAKIYVIPYLLCFPEALDLVKELHASGFPLDTHNYTCMWSILNMVGNYDISFKEVCKFVVDARANLKIAAAYTSVTNIIQHFKSAKENMHHIMDALDYLFAEGMIITYGLKGEKMVNSMEAFMEAVASEK